MTDQYPSIRVILADDLVVERARIRQSLECGGDIQILAEAGDGDAALTIIQNTQPDVAVLDIHMPKASGIEVACKVRANRWPVGLLILTSYDDAPYISAVLHAGANGYVLRTASPDEIIQAVRDVSQGKSVLDESILPTVLAQRSNQKPVPETDLLTQREIEILTLVAMGSTNKVIAVKLNITSRTVKAHLARIFGKLHAYSRTEAVMRAIFFGLIKSPEYPTNYPLRSELSFAGAFHNGLEML